MLALDGPARKLLRNAGWTATGGVLSSLLVAGQSVLAARLLGSMSFGQLALALGLAGIIVQFADFRTWEVVVRLVEERTVKADSSMDPLATIQGLLLVDLGAGMLASLTTVLLAESLASVVGGDDTLTALVRTYALALPGLLLSSGTCMGVLRLHDKFRLLAAKSVVVSAVQIGLVALVLLTGGGLQDLVLVYVLVETVHGLASVLILGSVLSRRGEDLARFSWARIRERLGAGRLLLGHAWLSGTIKGAQTRLDVPLLGALTSASVVGYYRVALDLAGVISKIGNPIQQAILPVMVGLEREGNVPRLRRLAAQTTLGLALPIVPTVAGAIAFATPAMQFLAGEEYAAAGPALAILVAAIGLSTLLVWARPLLVTRLRVAAGNLIAVVGVGIQVAVMLLLARHLGAIGASVATAAMFTFASLGTALAALW